jgi:adenylate kinase
VRSVASRQAAFNRKKSPRIANSGVVDAQAERERMGGRLGARPVSLAGCLLLVSGRAPAFSLVPALMTTHRDRTAWLKGGAALCENPPQKPNVQRRLVLLGAPGVGKGTQAELLSAALGACHLSTGDIFRAAKALDTCELRPALSSALGYMKRGELVPDKIVLDLLRERVRCLRCEGGFLLDGFPRTVAQAEALEKLLSKQKLKLDAVLNYELPLELVVARLSGRRTCPDCKAVFHVETRPPKRAGLCDQCGGRLYQREDDRPESIRVRMETYEKSTTPLAEFYRARNLLVTISGAGSPEDIFERSLRALGIKADECTA